MAERTQFEIEYPLKASPEMLYPYLSTPSGLSEWFSDDVNSRGEFYTFIWEGSEETAKLISKKQDKYIRFKWAADVDEGNKYCFEFRIVVDDITQDASLIIIDFADPDEVEEAKLLWNSQIHRLLYNIGS